MYQGTRGHRARTMCPAVVPRASFLLGCFAHKAMKPAKPPAGPFWCKEKLKEKLKFTTITVPVHTGTTGSTFERNTSAMLLPMKHE